MSNAGTPIFRRCCGCSYLITTKSQQGGLMVRRLKQTNSQRLWSSSFAEQPKSNKDPDQRLAWRGLSQTCALCPGGHPQIQADASFIDFYRSGAGTRASSRTPHPCGTKQLRHDCRSASGEECALEDEG